MYLLNSSNRLSKFPIKMKNEKLGFFIVPFYARLIIIRMASFFKISNFFIVSLRQALLKKMLLSWLKNYL